MLLKLAWRNIWRNKRRSLITMASIFFAVFFAISMRSLQLGTYDMMIENVVRYYAGYIQIHKKGYWEEKTLNNSFNRDTELIKKVNRTEGVEAVVPRLESFALGSHGELTRGVQIVGIDPEAEEELTRVQEKVTRGKVPDSGDRAVLIGKKLAEYFNLSINDTLVFLGQGFHGVTAASMYPVKGIANFNNPELNKILVFLPLKEAQWFYGTGNRITSLALLINDSRETRRIAGHISDKTDPDQYEVMGWRKMMPELVQAIQADSAGGLIMLFILYMVISFGIFGTLLMMTAERKYEFGVLTSIGMKRWKLGIIVMMESLFLAVMGVISGIIGVAPLVIYFNANPIKLTGNVAKAVEEYGFEPMMPALADPSIALNHGLIVLIIAILLSLYPVIVISGLKPVEAMRS